MQWFGIIFLLVLALPFLLGLGYFAWQLVKSWRAALDIALNVFLCLGCLYLLSFFALMVTVLVLGGSPQDSKIEGGRYFVGMHHVYHEVSRNTFMRFQSTWDWFDRSERWFLLLVLWGGLLLAISYVTGNRRRKDDSRAKKSSGL